MGKGVIDRVIINVRCNWLTSDDLVDLIRQRVCYTNRGDPEGLVAFTSLNVRNMIEDRRLDTLWFKSNEEPFVLVLPLPFKFNHELPKGNEKEILTYDRKLTRVEIKTWEEIKAQIAKQAIAIKYIEAYGLKAYRSANPVKRRYNPTMSYKPKYGVNVEGIWSSFEATFELKKPSMD